MKIAFAVGVAALATWKSFGQVQIINNPQAMNPLQWQQYGQQFNAPINAAIQANNQNQLAIAQMQAQQAFAAQQQTQRLNAEAAAQRWQLDAESARIKRETELILERWKERDAAEERARKAKQAEEMLEKTAASNKFKIETAQSAIKQVGISAEPQDYITPTPPSTLYPGPYQPTEL